MMKEINNELIQFLNDSPTCFHAVMNISRQLEESGFTNLAETKPWELKKGGKYYTTRNQSSIIAFVIGAEIEDYHFQVSATHSDSPSFKVKEKAEIFTGKSYLQLNTEPYGGMLASTWFDRPLSLAGRVLIKEHGHVFSKLLNIDRDLLIIPNVAIHLNRKANDGINYNNQVDLLPLFGGVEANKDDYYELLASQLKVKKENILGSDIFLYNRDRAIQWGYQEQFISGPRIDDLECTFASLKGFLEADIQKTIAVFSCFDNEEVGSGTKQGAASTFLHDVLQRINDNLGYKADDYYQAIAKSFMLSCDNAHALHPNHPELVDKTNCVYMNKGVVIKDNANQKYTTDGISKAVFTDLCNHYGIPYQHFANRSDMASGGTLGNISSTKVSMNTIDIGLAQLAMHSTFETVGSHDVVFLAKACQHFFATIIETHDENQMKLVYR